MLAMAGYGVCVFALGFGGMKGLPPVLKAVLLNFLAMMVLSLLRPMAGKGFGANWIFMAPGVLFALEAGQASLFLSLKPSGM